MTTPSPNPPNRRKKTRPARVKHVPVRTCIACRTSGAKRALTRIVRTPEGDVRIDLTGKLNGRGAYLCDRPACWERALSSKLLNRALNVELTAETIDTLREFAASLPPEVEAEPNNSAEQEQAV